MTYAQFNQIQASDFNTLATTLNSTWSTGSGVAGYGQTAVTTTIPVGNIITAANWQTLVSNLDSAYRHQNGGAGSGLTQPAQFSVITFVSAINTINSSITNGTNRTNGLVGTAITPGTITNATGWITSSVKEINITFASANAMRYFFNANGRVEFGCTASTLSGNAKSLDWNGLLSTSQAGTVGLKNTSTVRVNGTGGTTNFVGLQSMGTGNVTVLTQASTNATGGYTSNSVQFYVRLNAAYGSATVLTLGALLTDGSTDVLDDTVTGTVAFTVTAYPPATTYLTNTWGTPTLAGGTNTQA